MVDLRQQYSKIEKEINNAVLNVLDSSHYINGKEVQDFATNLAKYLDVKYVIPCANGTDALQIALMALGLEPGDEVITPSFTFIATTEVIALLRLKPVFVEVDPKTFCINPDELLKLITPKTKAIVPVHLYGQTAPMDEIMAIAKKHNLFVIEDNAQAIGADYISADGKKRKAGTIGNVGTTSFFPSKNLGAYGDGGAIFTNDDLLFEKIRMVANHGQSKRYYHDIVGCNSRLDTLQAAILNIKLQHLDEYILARQTVANFYDRAFENNSKISIPFRSSSSTHVFHQYTLLLNEVENPEKYRNELIDFLAQNGIPAMIYYPVPGHKQKMFEQFNSSFKEMPTTDWLTQRVFSLPIHTEMDTDQLNFITSKVLAFLIK